MPIFPEPQARERIDAMLTAAGWAAQSRDTLKLHAARGVVVRETHQPEWLERGPIRCRTAVVSATCSGHRFLSAIDLVQAEDSAPMHRGSPPGSRNRFQP